MNLLPVCTDKILFARTLINLYMLLFDDKLKMVKKPGKKQKKNPVGCTGEGKRWEGNIREGKTETVLQLSFGWGDPCEVGSRLYESCILYILWMSEFRENVKLITYNLLSMYNVCLRLFIEIYVNIYFTFSENYCIHTFDYLHLPNYCIF